MDILKKEICFLSKDKIYCTKNEKNYSKEVILSPYYYWYFEKKLPVTNMKRAKAIVSQMLESSLPQNKKFQYILRQKEKNLFEIFALDYDLLIGKLNTLGIDKKMVSSISFSHIELEDSAIELDDTILFHFENNVSEIEKKETIASTLLKVDMKSFLENKQKLLYKYTFSKGNLLQKSIDILDTSFLAVASILVLFFVSITIQIFNTSSISNQYEQQKEALLKSQTYATHSVQLKYVMDEVLQLDFKQKSLKNTMNEILKINATTTTYMAKIEYDDGDWFLDVIAPDKNSADSLLNNKKFNFIRSEKNIFKYEKVK